MAGFPLMPEGSNLQPETLMAELPLSDRDWTGSIYGTFD
jgi:hypothetical protein